MIVGFNWFKREEVRSLGEVYEFYGSYFFLYFIGLRVFKNLCSNRYFYLIYIYRCYKFMCGFLRYVVYFIGERV